MTSDMPPGYRSATEYQFRQEQADSIIHTTSYHRKDFDLAVISFSPREHAHVRSSMATSFRYKADRGLGSLNKLPLELFYEVLLCMDMRAVLELRQTSRRARELVDASPQYHTVVSHGLDLFCALLRTRLADSVSLADFYTALCIKACVLCGEFSGFISLLTWKRCCFRCLQIAPELRLQSLVATRKQLRLTKKEADQLRSFKTIPGRYSMLDSSQKSPISVVCISSALLLVKTDTPALSQLADSRQNLKMNFMGAVALPYYDRRSGEIEYGLSCAGCQLAMDKGIIGARAEQWAFEARNKVYSRDGLLQHFRWCEQAQGLWESSDGGTIQPSELPYLARRGGFFFSRD